MTGKTYRVFSGAPKLTDPSQIYSWHSISTQEETPLLPKATLEEAEYRLSMLYKNVIFTERDISVQLQIASQEGE